MKISLKNRVGIAMLLMGSLLLIAFPAIAEDSENGMNASYEAYVEGQEYAESLAEIEANKEAVVHELAAKWEGEARERGNDETWRDKIEIQLSEQDAETLLSRSEADSFEDFIGIQTTSELVYYPLKPCRLVDTRFATRWGFHTPLSGGGTRSFDTWGPLSGQGGASSCGVSSAAAGVVINVTAVSKGVSTGDGWVAVWPYLQSRPNASLVNYNGNSASGATANATVQSQCYSCSDELYIYASKTTHFIVDVIGYMARNTRTPVDNDVRFASKSVSNGASFDLWSPACPSGFRLTGGGFGENNYDGVNFIASRPVQGLSKGSVSGTNLVDRYICQGRNQTGGTRTAYCYSVCSRIPGR